MKWIAGIALEDVGGFTVEIRDAGAAALDIAPVFGPDLIVLDVMMPGMDGPSTLEVSRSMPGLGSIPIVFTAAKTMRMEVELYKNPGVLEVIPKPFDPMTLSDVVLPGGMNGLKIAAEARRSKPDLKLVYLSGYLGDALERHGGTDADAVLIQKPFDDEILGQHLREVLDQG